jgi:hypothetical protein
MTSLSAIYYSNKIHTNPDFYQKEKKRIADYMKNRYNTDEAYREKKKKYHRERYQLLKQNKLIEIKY